MFGNTNDLFGMLSVEDKLDGTNYPMWAYMMKHVLVAKNLWLYVCGDEQRPPSVSTSTSSSQASGSGDGGAPSGDSSHVSTTVQVRPTQDQLRWDARDAQAHALIALSCRWQVIPHIRSCKSSKEAWDVLTSLYQVHNEACVAFLRKKLDNERMSEGEPMDAFLTCIKDLRE